jgi:hypothetical protein
MLPLGRIGIRAERGEPRESGFTRDEQVTLMTLFAIFGSPLMFGGNLPDNDTFTLSLINNREVIYVNQNAFNREQLFRNGDLIAWRALDPENGDIFLALFNATDTESKEKGIETDRLAAGDSHAINDTTDITVGPVAEPPESASIEVSFDMLGITGPRVITDIWTGKMLGEFNGSFSREVKRHGAGLYRIHDRSRDR